METGWLALDVASAAVGLLLFVATARSLVRAMLTPRINPSRVARLGRRTIWRTAWFLASRRSTFRAQDAALAGAGPVAFVVNLVLIMALFLVACAAMTYGVIPGTFADALYQSGSTLLTLGFVEPVNAAAAVIAFVAAFTGLVVVAVAIGYLLALYSAYTLRETQVTKAGLLAGEPAWGPELLCRHHLLLRGVPLSPEEEGWVDWVCQVRSSQSVYPILNQFRSPSPHRNWVITLLAMLDATNLQLSLCADPPGRGCREFLAEGIQTLGVLRRNQDIDDGIRQQLVGPEAGDPFPLFQIGGQGAGVTRAIHADFSRLIAGTPGKMLIASDPSQLTRSDFDRACDLLTQAGIPLVGDVDSAWELFASIRSRYEANAYALAARLHAVPAPWSGPRRLPVETIWPNLAAEMEHPEPG